MSFHRLLSGSIALAVCLSALGVFALLRQAPKSVRLELEPAATKLRQYDPLILKLTLTNPSDEAKELSGRGMTLVELKAPGQQSFVGVNHKDPGLPPLKPLLLPARTSSIEYEALFWDWRSSDFMLAQAGEYQLRARALLKHEEVFSRIVTIQVDDAPAPERRKIDMHAFMLRGLFQRGLEVPELALQFADLDAGLGERELKRYVQRAHALRRWMGSDTPVDVATVERGWQREMQGESAVLQEFLALQAARAFVSTQQLKLAEHFALKLPEFCSERGRIQRTVANYRELERLRAEFFADDKRLDVEVGHLVDKPSTIGQILESFAKQSKITLDGDETVKSGSLMYATKGKLRHLMLALEGIGKAKWVRRGDGYYLEASKPAPEPVKKQD